MAKEPANDPDQRRAEDAPGGGTGKIGPLSVSLFLFATMMFLPPLVMLGEGDADLFGLPRIYVVLFAVWIAVVGMIYLIAERVDRSGPPEA